MEIEETHHSNKTLESYNYNSVNPFLKEAVMHIEENKKYKKKAAGIANMRVLGDDGEVVNQQMLVLKESKQVSDKQEWYKMYFGSIKHFFKMSPATLTIWEFLMKSIKYGEDRVCLYIPDTITQTNLSKASVHRGILQLLELQLIAKADRKGCYYINPSIAFKGDRITLIQEYIRVDERKEEQEYKNYLESKSYDSSIPPSV